MNRQDRTLIEHVKLEIDNLLSMIGYDSEIQAGADVSDKDSWNSLLDQVRLLRTCIRYNLLDLEATQRELDALMRLTGGDNNGR